MNPYQYSNPAFNYEGQAFHPIPYNPYTVGFPPTQQQYVSTPAIPYNSSIPTPQPSSNDPNDFTPNQETLQQQSTQILLLLTRSNQDLLLKTSSLSHRLQSKTDFLSSLSKQFVASQTKTRALRQDLASLELAFRDEKARGVEKERRIRELEAEGREWGKEWREREMGIKAKCMLDVAEVEREVLGKSREVEGVRRENGGLLDRVEELEDVNKSLTQSYANLTADRDRERTKCEAAESRLQKAMAENAELVEKNVREITAREDAVAAQEALKTDLDVKAKEKEDLEDQKGELEFDNGQLTLQVSSLEDRIRKLEVIAIYTQDLRIGLFHTGHGGYINRAILLARNKAAHFGNVYVDMLLFDLGFLDPSEKPYCEEKYAVSPDFSIDIFIGNNEMLQALSGSAWANVLNMHAYLDSEMKFEMKAKLKERLEQPLARFRVLEAECLERYQFLCAQGTEEEALRNFENDAVIVKFAEMEGIVQQFRDIKRDRDARPR
ncbi:hypothetical protein L207DRAFT_636877 [Hyaloscypha variabilis F]|uniref:Uncharacterized protein n=1 Tax=Hyaloscypha variabilis (strain UAMH 11265 / GT02V1 / F) TaxID=1149755 RepID=A0A2J6RES7_HYAVF|nr:hypothetical protein L207DRAFT_636877 [Hyaloscypha variabilis F]